MFKHCSRFRANRSGAAAIEFAILGPVFILILFGFIAYGIYFSAASSIQQLAADAARTAVAGLNEAERVTLTENFIRNNAGGYVFIDAEHLKVTVGDSDKDSAQFKVTVEYDASNLPVWNLYRDLPMPGKKIVRTATIRLGGI